MTTRAGKHEPRLAVKMGRQYRRQTQRGLAEALAETTGTTWTLGMVRDLERGHRKFTVDDLMAIAKVQDLPYEFYLIPPKKGLSEVPIIHGPSGSGRGRRPKDSRPANRYSLIPS